MHGEARKDKLSNKGDAELVPLFIYFSLIFGNTEKYTDCIHVTVSHGEKSGLLQPTDRNLSPTVSVLLP